jgi:hypothetical protein
MKDLTIALDDRPGVLADMGEALGKAGVDHSNHLILVVDEIAKARVVSEA